MTTNSPTVISTNANDQAVAPPQNEPSQQVFPPGCGLAIFSTDLCTRPKRALQGPPFPPVIVRSDSIKGVVDAAGFWQRKYKTRCLGIFPGQGWTIDDLWDADDQHIETPKFCEKMLDFISRDTYFAANKFAEDFARAYPERMGLVGSNMPELYDSNDLFAIVDRIFIEGEKTDFPRLFLWHVAHMMRATIMMAGQANQVPPSAAQPAHAPPTQNQGARQVKNKTKAAKKGKSEVVQAPVAPVDATPGGASSKTNRKTTRVRPQKLTGPTDKSTTVEFLAPSAAADPGSSQQPPPPQPAQKHVDITPVIPPPQQSGPVGVAAGVHVSAVMSPQVPPQALKVVSKGKSRNTGSGSYTQPTTPQVWHENNNRILTTPYARQPSGGMTHMQSPPFMSVPMATAQPMMYHPNAMPPFVPGHSHHMMPPNMVPIPQFDPGMAHRSMMPNHPGIFQTAPMSHVYPHQANVPQGPAMGISVGYQYQHNMMMPQQPDPRAPVPRRTSQHNGNGTLYDPYNGANPKFNDAAGYGGNKKFMQNNFTNQPTQLRKGSGPGNRPLHGVQNSERLGNMPANGGWYAGQQPIRGSSEEDPNITGDRTSGCHEYWIGPKNETVTELFVGDLPTDARAEEVKQLFEQHIGISPGNISVKISSPYGRCHAFVT